MSRLAWKRPRLVCHYPLPSSPPRHLCRTSTKPPTPPPQSRLMNWEAHSLFLDQEQLTLQLEVWNQRPSLFQKYEVQQRSHRDEQLQVLPRWTVQLRQPAAERPQVLDASLTSPPSRGEAVGNYTGLQAAVALALAVKIPFQTRPSDPHSENSSDDAASHRTSFTMSRGGWRKRASEDDGWGGRRCVNCQGRSPQWHCGCGLLSLATGDCCRSQAPLLLRRCSGGATLTRGSKPASLPERPWSSAQIGGGIWLSAPGKGGRTTVHRINQ
ncbi:hypothetical protein AAFF_G00210530 [Aldrovandia affinis]|uniref:Uncharacterized protein n=1 Tax=Aldrovandia affinis TaxID=143900 RepID=A0AAD7SWC5_9TELE|nr:hypothetical protein AAFF_G00210530 [Aldrovandia affinis]